MECRSGYLNIICGMKKVTLLAVPALSRSFPPRALNIYAFIIYNLGRTPKF